MRSLYTCLAGTILTAALSGMAAGCGGGPSSLEANPDVAKKVDPMTDMPGFKEMQDQLKKQGKIPNK